MLEWRAFETSYTEYVAYTRAFDTYATILPVLKIGFDSIQVHGLETPLAPEHVAALDALHGSEEEHFCWDARGVA